MPTHADTLADCVLATKPLLTRFVTGFEGHATTQAPGVPNHASWTLGHCALTMHRVAEMHLDKQPLPASDFVTGDGTAGDAERFDTESVCFDSVPLDDPSIYPSLTRAQQVFEQACDRLASALRAADDAAMDTPIPWHDGSMPLGRLIMRICFHNGTHAGQLIDLRRALDLGRVIG